MSFADITFFLITTSRQLWAFQGERANNRGPAIRFLNKIRFRFPEQKQLWGGGFHVTELK